MSTLLYRFDDPGRFPILESQTTDRTTWRVTATEVSGEPAMCVGWQPEDQKPSSATLCLALPRIAIDGAPVRLGLELRGDASGCRFCLDATDRRGPGFRYVLGPVSFVDKRTCWADVDRPAEYWEGTPPDDEEILPPLQLHRLFVVVAPPSRRVNIALIRLNFTGDALLTSPAIA